MEQPVQVTRYGIETWELPEMDAVRRANCMCRDCGSFKPGHPDHCKVADELYVLCVTHGLAMMLTRCSHWTPPADE